MFPHLTKWQIVISSLTESNSQQTESRDREADKEFSCYGAGQIRCHAFKMLEEIAALLPMTVRMAFYAWQFSWFKMLSISAQWAHIAHNPGTCLEKYLELLGA